MKQDSTLAYQQDKIKKDVDEAFELFKQSSLHLTQEARDASMILFGMGLQSLKNILKEIEGENE